jgi:hypothetical protein
MTDKPQHEKLKIEKREPHWKPWVNSSAPEGWTYPDPPVVPEYITFTIRRMYIAQVQSNYRTFLQWICSPFRSTWVHPWFSVRFAFLNLQFFVLWLVRHFQYFFFHFRLTIVLIICLFSNYCFWYLPSYHAYW